MHPPPFVYALLTLCLLGQPGLCQSGSISVVWLKNDPGRVVSTSGEVGSQAFLHIHFTPPPNAERPAITQLWVHEVAGHELDGPAANLSFNGSTFPECPQCNPLTSEVYSVGWNSVNGHNGPHTVSCTCEYWLASGRPRELTQHFYTLAPITVDVENTIVTPTLPPNPNPILWDPPDPIGSYTVPVNANIHLAYRTTMTPITLEIFKSDQSLVKTVHLDRPLAPGDNTVEYAWGGSQDPPLTGTAPKGVYIFRWTAGPWPYSGDSDRDKSELLQITATRFRAGQYDPGTGQITLIMGCVLRDSGNPRRDASTCNVRAYNSALDAVAGPSPLATLTNPPGEQNPIWDEGSLVLPGSGGGEYTFLFAAKDDHPDTDKGHRQLWALQKNQKAKQPPAVNFDFREYPQPHNPPQQGDPSGPPETTPRATTAAQKQGAPNPDDSHPDLGYTGGAFTNQTARAALDRIIKPAGQGDVNSDPAIFFVFGHGGDVFQPTQMFWTGKQNDPAHQAPLGPDADWYDRAHRKTHCSFIVQTLLASQQMAALQPDLTKWEGWNGDCRYIDDTQIPNDAFRRILLGVFLGCCTGRVNEGWGNPPRGLVTKGARLAVGWVPVIWSHDLAKGRKGAEEFADAFWEFLCKDGQPLEAAIRNAFRDIPAITGIRRYHIYGRLEDGSVGTVEGQPQAQLRIHPARWGNDPEG